MLTALFPMGGGIITYSTEGIENDASTKPPNLSLALCDNDL